MKEMPQTSSVLIKMREQILKLERSAQPLEPAAAERSRVRGPVLDYSEAFLNGIDEINAFNISDKKGAGLLESPIEETGIGIDELISLLRENVDTPGLNPASGGHLGYIPGGGIYTSALGDYLADVFNRYAGGQSFGFHVDNAVRYDRSSGARPEPIRTDLSITLFLSDPASYDGGELVIEDTYGTKQVKLAAGDAVLYPGTSLHRVMPVTRGERVASFFWLQSMLRDDG